MPPVFNWLWREAKLIVELFDRTGNPDELKALAGHDRIVSISSRWFGASMMALWLIVAYGGTAVVVQAVRRRWARQRAGKEDH